MVVFQVALRGFLVFVDYFLENENVCLSDANVGIGRIGLLLAMVF